MEKIILFGLGDFASIAYQLFTHDSPYEVAGFTVDRGYIRGAEFHGLPVIPFDEVERIFDPQHYKIYVLASFKRMNDLRASKYLEAKKKGFRFVNYISSKAITWPNLEIGENCCIMSGTIVDPYVKIGNNVVLWDGNVVGHHTIIKDHCFITSHVVIGGNSIIEPNCFLGANATIREETTVARRTLVGAGVTILADTEPGQVFKAPAPEILGIHSDQLRTISHKQSG